MSVFAALQAKVDDHAGKRTPDQLERGMRYTIYKVVMRKSDYPDSKTGEFPMNLVVFLKHPVTGSKYYVTMPGLYSNLSAEHFAELEASVAGTTPPFIVFYGKDGNRNVVTLHQHNESVNQSRMVQYAPVQTPPS